MPMKGMGRKQGWTEEETDLRGRPDKASVHPSASSGGNIAHQVLHNEP